MSTTLALVGGGTSLAGLIGVVVKALLTEQLHRAAQLDCPKAEAPPLCELPEPVEAPVCLECRGWTDDAKLFFYFWACGIVCGLILYYALCRVRSDRDAPRRRTARRSITAHAVPARTTTAGRVR